MVSLSVAIPMDDSNPAWKLEGQSLLVEVPSVMRTVKEVKEILSPMLGEMPVNKMQLKSVEQGFLKDGQTLASYNLGGPGSSDIELVTRSRGGRK
jgi:hypothetical protein